MTITDSLILCLFVEECLYLSDSPILCSVMCSRWPESQKAWIQNRVQQHNMWMSAQRNLQSELPVRREDMWRLFYFYLEYFRNTCTYLFFSFLLRYAEAKSGFTDDCWLLHICAHTNQPNHRLTVSSTAGHGGGCLPASLLAVCLIIQHTWAETHLPYQLLFGQQSVEMVLQAPSLPPSCLLNPPPLPSYLIPPLALHFMPLFLPEMKVMKQ